MFELREVVKTHGEDATAVRALDGLSLTITDGEFVVVEGPNGSGKSTLLQMLGALDRPSSGSVLLDGRDLAGLSASKLAALRLRNFGFVFEHFNLVPTLSALENVLVALAPLRGTRRRKRERALRLLNGVGLADRADHLPSQLSGGEQQRVAIARALSKGPRVILADEPTGNLDTRTGNEIMTVLRRLASENGQTVVLSTRDPAIAAAAPRVVRLRRGRLDDATASIPPAASQLVPDPISFRSDSEPGAPKDAHWVPTASTAKWNSDPIMHAEGVVKHYVSAESHEDVVGIEGVSLIVHEGEFVAITGPSGSGKTTLLNCLSGLDRIDRGRVLICGRTVHDLSDKEQSHLRSEVMGFIFQNWNLVPVFSAVENVELPLLLNGEKPSEARAAATRTLERIGLGHRLDHHPNALSGGEQQRVAIARALAANPRLVWADEPTGNLDSATAESVMKLLRELNDDGLAIVLVTHDESIAEQATRRIYMRDGKLLADMTRRNAVMRPSEARPAAAAPPLPDPASFEDAMDAVRSSTEALRDEMAREVEATPVRQQANGMTKAQRRAQRRAARMGLTEPSDPSPRPRNP